MITLLFNRKSLMLVSACCVALALCLFFGGTAVGLRIQLEATSLNVMTDDTATHPSYLAPPPSDGPIVAAARAHELSSPPREVHASATGALRAWEDRDLEPWDPLASRRAEEPSSSFRNGGLEFPTDPPNAPQTAPSVDRPRAATAPPSETARWVRPPVAALPEEFLIPSHAPHPPRDEGISSRQARPAVHRSAQAPVSFKEGRTVGFTVQVGAYGEKDNAAAQMTALRAAGWDPVLIAEVGDPTRALFAVRLGRFPDRGSALEHADRFRSATDQDAIVRPLLGTERESP